MVMNDSKLIQRRWHNYTKLPKILNTLWSHDVSKTAISLCIRYILMKSLHLYFTKTQFTINIPGIIWRSWTIFISFVKAYKMETLKWVSLKRQIFLFIDNYYYYYAGKLVIFLLQNVVRIHCKAELSIVLHATQKKGILRLGYFFLF